MKKIVSILLAIIIFATILPLNIIATYATSGDLTAHALADKILQENLVPQEHLELTTTDSKELAELTSCAKKIVSGLTTDYQKMEAVCKYVATNVYYDYDCYYERTDYTYFTPYDVFKNGYAVCAGYENLSKELLNIVGIPCVQIRGENHAYSAAYDSKSQKWIYFDATWCSGNVYENGKKTKGNYNSFFFDISIEDLSKISNHEISIESLAGSGIQIKQGNIIYSLIMPNADTPELWRDVNNWYLSVAGYIGKPSNVTIIEKIEKYNLPVKEIDWWAFGECTSLTQITIPNSVERIKEMAFYNCKSLTSIIIPNTVKTIDYNVFTCCTSLKNVYYRGTKTEWSKINIMLGNEDLLSAKIHYNYVLNGWIKENDKWAYYVNDARLTNKWLKDRTGWCYVGADGYMVTNKWVMDSVGWCYVGADGYCVTNCWKKDSYGWCYLGSNGRMVCNNWVYDKGKWYFMDSEGYMVSNKWIKDSKGWVYLGSSGAMLTNSWIKDSVGWCYVGADGYCVTNKWVKDSIGWCYLDSDGRMATNKWVEDSVGWCYVGEDGYCVKNQWIYENDKSYYLDTKGYRVTGNAIIDGTEYFFNEDGELVLNTDISNEPEIADDLHIVNI